jgi:hypothetical protein
MIFYFEMINLMKVSVRDKSILIGLFLSKFDIEGLYLLGFDGYVEAYNALGYSIGAKPASLKNYRDEFDPLFPNPRKGWHKRKLRDYCKVFYDEYKDWDAKSFAELIKRIVYQNYELEELFEKTNNHKRKEETFAKRLITGQAAEQYFKYIYHEIPIFQNLVLEDTTKLGCGFDFKLSSNSTNKFFGVEVKGLNGLSGDIALTEKEFRVAGYLKQDYFLFIVKNFVEKPTHIYYQNPLGTDLKFKKIETRIIQVSYNTRIDK